MKCFLLPCLIVLTNSINAQPYLDSFDINKKNSGLDKHSQPHNLYPDGNTLYFSATDSLNKNEVWVFYSNTNAPQKVTDVNYVLGGYSSIAKIDEMVFFTVLQNASSGMELWSHNISTGSQLVMDINPGPQGSQPLHFLVYDSKLYFSAKTEEHGRELWVHTPADNSTLRLTDINPDSSDGIRISTVGWKPVVFDNKIYFPAGNDNIGEELYVYDPNNGTTQLVADINTGYLGSTPRCLTVLGNKLYFIAYENYYGMELFEYDGNNAPVRLTDLRPGTGYGVTNYLNTATLNNILYFAGYDVTTNGYQLFSYDPASNTTSKVYTINQKGDASPRNFGVYNNKLFFVATDSIHGHELWMYDGTNTPVRVTDIAPGSKDSHINYVTPAGLGLFFIAWGEAIGIELFRYSDFPASVQNVRFDGKASVFPNPAKETANMLLELNSPQVLSTSLTDACGRIVYNSGSVLYSASTHTIHIPVAHLPLGIYFYHIMNVKGNQMASGRLAKE